MGNRTGLGSELRAREFIAACVLDYIIWRHFYMTQCRAGAGYLMGTCAAAGPWLGAAIVRRPHHTIHMYGMLVLLCLLQTTTPLLSVNA